MQFIENTKGIPSKGQLFYRFEGGKFEEERRLQKNVSYLTENAEDNAYAVRNLDLMNKGLRHNYLLIHLFSYSNSEKLRLDE